MTSSGGLINKDASRCGFHTELRPTARVKVSRHAHTTSSVSANLPTYKATSPQSFAACVTRISISIHNSLQIVRWRLSCVQSESLLSDWLPHLVLADSLQCRTACSQTEFGKQNRISVNALYTLTLNALNSVVEKMCGPKSLRSSIFYISVQLADSLTSASDVYRSCAAYPCNLQAQ
jgi:hypothetical protein